MTRREYGHSLPARCRLPAGSEELFILYAVLLRVKGEQTSPSDVHDAWCAWQWPRDASHPCLVPYSDLDEVSRQADLPFVAAIRRAATLSRAVAETAGNGDDDPDAPTN